MFGPESDPWIRLAEEVEHLRKEDRQRLAEREKEGDRIRDEERDRLRQREDWNAYVEEMRAEERRAAYEHYYRDRERERERRSA